MTSSESHQTQTPDKILNCIISVIDGERKISKRGWSEGSSIEGNKTQTHLKKHRPMFTKEAPSPPRAPGFLMSDQNYQHKHKHKPISLSKNILFNMHITAVLLNDCVPT